MDLLSQRIIEFALCLFTPSASVMQWSITLLILTEYTAPMFTNKVLYNIHMTLTTSNMQWSITILVLTGCTAPLFTSQISHNVHMAITTSLKLWRIAKLTPLHKQGTSSCPHNSHDKPHAVEYHHTCSDRLYFTLVR